MIALRPGIKVMTTAAGRLLPYLMTGPCICLFPKNIPVVPVILPEVSAGIAAPFSSGGIKGKENLYNL